MSRNAADLSLLIIHGEEKDDWRAEKPKAKYPADQPSLQNSRR